MESRLEPAQDTWSSRNISSYSHRPDPGWGIAPVLKPQGRVDQSHQNKINMEGKVLNLSRLEQNSGKLNNTINRVEQYSQKSKIRKYVE